MALKQTSFKLNTGASIPAMALGTWAIAKGEVGRVVKLAIELGYRHLDCARLYLNEAEIGEALEEVFAEGKVKREDLFITSKLWSNCHQPEHVMPACQESLDNLRLDYLDLYLIHNPIRNTKGVFDPRCMSDVIGYNREAIQQTWKAMEDLVAKGLCKAIGVSNFSSKKVASLLETATIVPACNQVELHPYLPQPQLKELCGSKGILLEGYSPLGSPARPFPKKMVDAEPRLLDDPVLKEIALKHGCSVAKVALRWGIQRGHPVLPKATSRDHLHDNLDALSLELTNEDMEAINNIKIHNRYMKIDFMYRDDTMEDVWDGEA